MTRPHRLHPLTTTPALAKPGSPVTGAPHTVPVDGRDSDHAVVMQNAASARAEWRKRLESRQALCPGEGLELVPRAPRRILMPARDAAAGLLMRAARRLLALLTLALAPGLAAAHDTWFTVAGPTPRGELSLALGTGNQFPAYEVPVALEQLKASGCRGEAVKDVPLRRLAERKQVLLLRTARAVPATAALTCWAQLVPIDIQIDDKLVDIYLDEINAQPALRAHWAQLKARGVRWSERYEKHARIEIDGDGVLAEMAPVETLGLDARLLAPQRPVRAGDTVRFQVLKDGQPLAGLPVELRSDISPLGLWRVTDARGVAQFTVPLAARWLLRGTEVLPSTRHPEHFDSRFITLVFEARPRR